MRCSDPTRGEFCAGGIRARRYSITKDVAGGSRKPAGPARVRPLHGKFANILRSCSLRERMSGGMRVALKRRLWLVLGIAVALAVLLLILNWRRPAPRVAVVPITRENLSTSISSNGKVEPIAPYSMRAEMDTYVTHVYATEGQAVHRGQLLVELDDAAERAALDQARAQLASEEDALRSAQSGGRADARAKYSGDVAAADARRDALRQQNAALVKLVAQQAATPAELADNRAQLAAKVVLHRGREIAWTRGRFQCESVFSVVESQETAHAGFIFSPIDSA